jgi:cobalt/nickel transport system permease protein
MCERLTAHAMIDLRQSLPGLFPYDLRMMQGPTRQSDKEPMPRNLQASSIATRLRRYVPLLAFCGLGTLLPSPAYAMHIAEGIITGWPVLAYTLMGIGLMGVGAKGIEKFQKDHPERRPLIGMAAAIIFFISLIPIPAFTGTTSHPCGTPLVAILLGPRVTFALTGISLLLQAAFFAHGGFGTWGANLMALGFVGGTCGWSVFWIARRMGLSILIAGCAGGLIGDIATYAFSGAVLATALSTASHPQYDFWTYLAVIYAAYAPTQVPVAIGEMLITGLALRHALRQRPEVLEDLNVWGAYATA